ncbi:MAG TPA: hypothetical protein VF439_00850 [Candidatus Paceibacterota bacterium]
MMPHLTTNQIIGALVILVVVAGGSFYAGQHAAGAHAAGMRGGYAAGGMMMGGQGGAQQGLAARTGGLSGARTGGAGAMGGLVSGSIVSKDATSVTVSLTGGGSEIVYLSPSTTVMKSDAGSADDLAAGQNVVITGAKNSDGSVSASSIQIRPAGTQAVQVSPAVPQSPR